MEPESGRACRVSLVGRTHALARLSRNAFQSVEDGEPKEGYEVDVVLQEGKAVADRPPYGFLSCIELRKQVHKDIRN